MSTFLNGIWAGVERVIQYVLMCFPIQLPNKEMPDIASKHKQVWECYAAMVTVCNNGVNAAVHNSQLVYTFLSTLLEFDLRT